MTINEIVQRVILNAAATVPDWRWQVIGFLLMLLALGLIGVVLLILALRDGGR